MSALDVNPAKRRRSGATSSFVGFTDDVDSGCIFTGIYAIQY